MERTNPPVGMRLDERAVRVLAHPLRARILGELRLHGPSTATDLAARLHTNTGATSYHLRALEGVALVADTGDGEGRRRLWRASTDYHSWTNSQFSGDDDAQAALGWLRRDYVRQFAARAERWLDAESAWPDEWVNALGTSDSFLTVTAAQHAQFQTELDDLVARYRDRGAGHAAAVRIHFVTQQMPVDPEDPPTEGDGEPGSADEAGKP